MFERSKRFSVFTALALSTVLGSSIPSAAAQSSGSGGGRPALRPDRVWVPPVYGTTYERTWVPQSIQRVADRVWIPPQYDYRPVTAYDASGHRIEAWEYVKICDGYYDTRWRDVTTPGHWDNVERRILITPGHWEIISPLPPSPPPPPFPPRPMPPIYTPPIIYRGDVPSVGVEGYDRAPLAEDRGPFSPTYDWPK